MAEKLVQLVATVPTGLEPWSVKECGGMPECISVKHNRDGKIDLTCREADVKAFRKLRSIDHLYVVVDRKPGALAGITEKDDCLGKAEELAWQLDFFQAVRVWKSFVDYPHHVPVADPFPGKPDELPLPTAAQYAAAPGTRGKGAAAVSTAECQDLKESPACSTECSSPERSGTVAAAVNVSSAGSEPGSADAGGISRGACQSVVTEPSSDEQDCPSGAGSASDSATVAESDGPSDFTGDGVATSCPGSDEGECQSPPSTPCYRATCNRAGMNHSFTSMDVARVFGGAVNDRHHWRVQLTESDIDVTINVVDNDIEVCLALTYISLHKRSITHFGRTVLRSTICNGLLRIASIQPGDVVCDPMCGVGSICLEGYQAFPHAAFFCGDIFESACERVVGNVQNISKSNVSEKKGVLPIDAYNWDATSLPLRSNSVDVFVTDLPFGKRVGSKASNKVLYPQVFLELARVCRLSTGRAVVITSDKRTMTSVLMYNKYWKTQLQKNVNVGGLKAGVYSLKRSEVPIPES